MNTLQVLSRSSLGLNDATAGVRDLSPSKPAIAPTRLQLVKQKGDVGSGATTRPQRETLIAATRRREIDCVLVWRLDRWGRSLADLIDKVKC